MFASCSKQTRADDEIGQDRPTFERRAFKQAGIDRAWSLSFPLFIGVGGLSARAERIILSNLSAPLNTPILTPHTAHTAILCIAGLSM